MEKKIIDVQENPRVDFNALCEELKNPDSQTDIFDLAQNILSLHTRVCLPLFEHYGEVQLSGNERLFDALIIVGHIDPKQIAELLYEKSFYIKRLAIEVIGYLGAKMQEIEIPLHVFLHTYSISHDSLLKDLVSSIGQLGPKITDEELIDALIKLLEDNLENEFLGDAELQRGVVKALGSIGPAAHNCVPVLLPLLSSLPKARGWGKLFLLGDVISALGAMGEHARAAEAELKALRDHKTPEIATLAVEVLSKLAGHVPGEGIEVVSFGKNKICLIKTLITRPLAGIHGLKEISGILAADTTLISRKKLLKGSAISIKYDYDSSPDTHTIHLFADQKEIESQTIDPFKNYFVSSLRN